MNQRYNDLNTYFRSIFGCRVQKITIDAGLTCPNRDGTISTGGCIFCNNRGSGSGASNRGLSLTDQLLQGKNFLSRRYKAKKFIAYFQSFSNTYAPPEILKRLYDEALAVEDIVGLARWHPPGLCQWAGTGYSAGIYVEFSDLDRIRVAVCPR